MDVLTDTEIDNIVDHSKLAAKYNQVIDSNSAYEMLTAKLQEAAANNLQPQQLGYVSQKTAKPEESYL